MSRNLPCLQSTEAIGTLMPLRTLMEASATKPSGFPATECMTLLGKFCLFPKKPRSCSQTEQVANDK